MMIDVLVSRLPERRTELDRMVHVFPSRVHVPSPNPPSASKLHERISLSAGSQPMRLRAVVENRVLHHHGARPDDEVLVGRPLERDPRDVRAVRLVDPLADEPLERAELLVVARRRKGRLPNAREEPAAVLLDEHVRVAGAIRQTAVGREDRTHAVLDCDVGRRELQRRDFDPDLQPLALREQVGEVVGDRLTTLQQSSAEIDVVAVGEPELGQRLGIAAFERRDERLGDLGDRGPLIGLRIIRTRRGGSEEEPRPKRL